MTDTETVVHLRQWESLGLFSWPTDACGYEQHMRFVDWRNRKLEASLPVYYQEYADLLEAGKIPAYEEPKP